jgi:BirA family transcriptional regulator, biotin operon repressor / biotin---[acetyl-CoA-carboxylase] ligase
MSRAGKRCPAARWWHARKLAIRLISMLASHVPRRAPAKYCREEAVMMLSMKSSPLTLDEVRRRLVSDTADWHFFLFADVDSTNDSLRDLAARGAREGTVVVAETQRRGRGRLGRAWFSPPGLNIYASVLFRPALVPDDMLTFSFIASLALVEALEPLGVSAQIKWPNDVLVDGKKVAGTLVDCGMRGAAVDYVVLGIGLNVNVGTAALRDALGPAGGFATSLAEVLGHEVDRNALLAAWLDAVAAWHLRWKREGPAALRKAWADRDILSGRRVEVRGDGQTFEGRVLGLAPTGALVVVDTLGHARQVTSEEVRLHD